MFPPTGPTDSASAAPAAAPSTSTSAPAAPVSKPDYSSWPQDRLIKHIQYLESQLPPGTTVYTPTTPPQKKKKPRPFNPATYPTRHIALLFSYLGQPYNGFEYSPGSNTPLPTVEETLFHALLKSRLVPPLPNAEDPTSVDAWPPESVTQYQKCGRTDRGVSAFGQVVSLRVRSNRPKDEEKAKGWDPVKDELNYVQILNRILPETIRVQAWAPDVPEGFSARFSCLHRTYRYFFTNPMLSPQKGGLDNVDGRNPGELDIEAMNTAAGYFLGTHDFRNFCKLDASKQITNFTRHILISRIVEQEPGVYYFELRGTAFLWHQVRHMIAMLFLVGQGFEKPEIIRDLLDIAKYPSKPNYEMSDDRPLCLWQCSFPDSITWVYGDGLPGRDKTVDSVFTLWQNAKIDEVLTRGLYGIVEGNLEKAEPRKEAEAEGKKRREREAHYLVTGDGRVVSRGRYIKVEERLRGRPVEEINAEYVKKKGGWDERRERREVKRRKKAIEGGLEVEGEGDVVMEEAGVEEGKRETAAGGA